MINVWTVLVCRQGPACYCTCRMVCFDPEHTLCYTMQTSCGPSFVFRKRRGRTRCPRAHPLSTILLWLCCVCQIRTSGPSTLTFFGCRNRFQAGSMRGDEIFNYIFYSMRLYNHFNVLYFILDAFLRHLRFIYLDLLCFIRGQLLPCRQAQWMRSMMSLYVVLAHCLRGSNLPVRRGSWIGPVGPCSCVA